MKPLPPKIWTALVVTSMATSVATYLHIAAYLMRAGTPASTARAAV